MLSSEALFGDLDLELFPEGDVDFDDEGTGAEGLPGRFAADAEAALVTGSFSPVSALLSDSDVPPTLPYDVPADAFAHAVMMWGDDERASALSTTPVSLEELPEDAFPTRFTLIEPEWVDELNVG